MANASAFAGIPAEIVVQIFNKLPFATKRTVLPLVCKGWQQLVAGTPELWGTVTLCALEERTTFLNLARAGLTGGLQLAAGGGRPFMKIGPIARWFQKNSAQASVLRVVHSSLAVLSDFSFRFGTGTLSLLLVTMKDSLRELEVGNFTWIEGDPSFSVVAWLTNLTSLTLTILADHRQFTPDDLEPLGALTKLETLRLLAQDLQAVPLQELPASFFELTQLKTLVITCLRVQTFPERLVTLSNLTELHLWRFGEFLLPQWSSMLAGPVGLRKLTLDVGNVLTLPDLSPLKHLQHLKVKGSMLTRLPVELLRSWRSLEEIEFESCPLMPIHERVALLAGLPALRLVSFRACKLSAGGVRALIKLVDALRDANPQRKVLVGSNANIDRDIANDRAQGVYPRGGHFKIKLA